MAKGSVYYLVCAFFTITLRLLKKKSQLFKHIGALAQNQKIYRKNQRPKKSLFRIVGLTDVVYMAPVKFNKDQYVSKAGIEIDIIPIKKSPYSSPTFQRRPTRRPKSQNDHRRPIEVPEVPETTSTTNTYLRASLPDIFGSRLDSKVSPARSAIYLPTEKLVSTFMTINQARGGGFSRDNLSETNTTSTDSLNQKGVVMNAVLTWLSQSSLFEDDDPMLRSTSPCVNSMIFDEDSETDDGHSPKRNRSTSSGLRQLNREACPLSESPLGNDHKNKPKQIVQQNRFH